ncbi:hypothetical protein [uncultured Ferrimonas sp.]|uniref:hypothetical protein n=1 Tax=uncultured Ferrimonas sp. TaxID=432640 RepID=UPI002635B572|nr:hypothetical protein [uncultured Ferrimonas sp.]
MMFMKYFKCILIVVVTFVAGTYGYYFLATEVNRHADFAATVIIEDTLASNAAYDLEKLREIEISIKDNDSDLTSKLIDDFIKIKTQMLQACVTEQCESIGKNRIK